MAYKAKFLHFKTKQSYNAERNKTVEGTDERKVFDAYISFIDEGPTICTWGKEYKCEISKEEIETLIDSKGFITLEDIPNIPIAGTSLPEIAGTAAAGTSEKYAREDHIHPLQTSVTGNAGTATKLQIERTVSVSGAVSGSASFDGSQDVTINTTLANVDASKITSGTLDADRLPEIPLEKLPAGALERLVIVENQAARYQLTTSDVQEGDTVKQEDTGVMYFVVDTNNLANENGYKVYTAGAATSVPWSGITGKPELLQLGETSTTAYAGDKGKELEDKLINLEDNSIIEAPIDGGSYVRSNGQWSKFIDGSSGIVVDTEFNKESDNPIANSIVTKSLSNKILEWNTDIATTRKQITINERKTGLNIRYAIDNKEWVEEKYISNIFTDTEWQKDSNWEYEKFKGEITDTSQAATLDKRIGIYYTTCAKGEFTNFLKSDGNPVTNYNDNYFSISRQATGSWTLANIQDIFYGNDYIWGMVCKGYISMNTSSRTDEGSEKKLFKYSLEVFPNTIILPINSIPYRNGYYAIKLKEGVYEFESIQNAVLFLVNPKTNEIEFSTSKATDTSNNINQTLPPPSDKNKYILLGCSGSQYVAGNYSYFPFIGMHMNVSNHYEKQNLGKTNEICCLNDYSFYDITSKVKNLLFKGECHLDLEDTDEDNIYYILGSTEANTYIFDNIPITITTDKQYSAFAIKKTSGEWSYEEVPLSFCGQNSTAPYHIVNSGVYIINKLYKPNVNCNFASNIVGIHGIGDVQLIFISETGEGALTLGDWYNVKVYGSIFIDYHQRDNNVRIENCEFSGPSWRTSGGTYFINCHFYKKWYSNVIIRNCKFTFDNMYTVIWGDHFENIEITGCEFNVKKISHPIRINIFKTSAIIRGNKVYNGITGIFFGSTKSFPQVGTIIENNTVMYQSEEGISCDGFGNNYGLIPVIANGNIEEAYNDENGRLVIKPHLYTGTSSTDSTLVDYPISTINNWKDYYITFNRGTGIDGTICRIYSYDAEANTFTLDIYTDFSKIKTSKDIPKLGNGSSEDSIIGVQSGFFDMVIRNNILKSDRQDYCTALSNYLNVFNTLIENNKVYLMNSFMNIAGGNMLSVMETLCWGVKVINNTFMNCNVGSFTSYWDSKLPQFNNVFQGNIIKNVKTFKASGQKNFVFRDNIWDNVDKSEIKNCESYIPDTEDLKVHQMGTIYNKFVNDNSTLLLNKIEQYIVDTNEEEILILKKL